MKPTNLPNKLSLFVCLIIGISFTTRSYSQITILTPTLDFTQACASADFNEFQVNFSFYPAQNLGADNEFLIELSDASGDFSAPVVLKHLTNSASPVREKFAIPETASGDAYKIRIRSTNPEFTSPSTTAFSAYYATHNQPFSINSYDSTVSLCQGQTYTLKIDNNNTPASPVYYPNLKYIWYKNFNEISGATSSELTVSEPGSYYCVVDYGNCVMDSYSNIVDVEVISDIVPEITASATALCNGSSVLLTSAITNSSYSYTWYKNNTAITNASGVTYKVLEPGDYQLEINMGGDCDFLSNTITINNLDFDVSINNNANTLLILPGNTLNLTAQTTAQNPSYTWFKNDMEITGESEAEILISEPGIYKVVVTQTEPCALQKEATITVSSPLYYELEISTDANYSSCSSTSTTLSISKFDAITNDDTINLIENTSNYTFQWYKNNSPITGATNSSIVIADASENGTYTLDVKLTDEDTEISNAIDVQLATENISITNDIALCNNQDVTLSANVSNSNYTYQWYKNNSSITGETNSSLITNTAGNYYLEVTSGNCTLSSNTIELIDGGINITSETPEQNVLLPSESKTIHISTDATSPTFSWYKNNELIETANQNSITVTEIGEYKVTVTQTEGCSTEISKTFVFTAPSNVSATIANDNFKTCTTDVMTISLTSLLADTDSGSIDLLEGDFSNYSFQWYKNNTIVNDANTLHLDITNPKDNGEYYVVAQVPNFGYVTSNSIHVHLTTVKQVSVSTQDGFCDTSSMVTITSDVTPTDDISFAWYKTDASTILSTSTTVTVNEAGTYYLEVTDGDCVIASNYLDIQALNEDAITTNYPSNINLVEGTTLTLTAEGAQNYNWFFNGAVVSTTNETSISEAGQYTLTASVNSCEVVKTFTVTEIENNAIAIPNTVTLNNDGINDTWALPNQYVNQPNIEIIIYKADGSVAFKSTNYMNNWPEQDYRFSNKSPVFYYMILDNGKTIKKGSITIVK